MKLALRRTLYGLPLAAALLCLARASTAAPMDREAIPGLVDRLAAEALERPGAVGIQVAVALKGEIVLEKGYGLAEVEHRVPVKATSVFRIGSVTKQFTAAAVMKLVEAGKIDLDAPLTKYYPGFPTGEKTVTVRHLLTHTSGIPSYTSLGPAWMRTVPLEMSNEELLELVKGKPLEFEPGTRFSYCNTGYYLLGVITTKVTGKPWGEHMKETLFEPLGLEHTRQGSNADIIPDRAQGYRILDGKLANDALIGMSQPGAAGALLSTAGDLVRWEIALSSGKVVSKKSYELMSSPYLLKNGKPTGYGFGLGIGKLGTHPVIQHGGGINGFNSMLAHYPDDGLTVAVLSNSEALPSTVLERRIAREILGIESKIEDLPITEAEIARVAGTYHLEGTPLDVKVWGEKGQLLAQATDQPQLRLRRQKNGEYCPDLAGEIRILFDEGDPAPGLTVHQGGAEVRGVREEE